MARRKAAKRRSKGNSPLTAEEIRLRHAASLESSWRRTAREAESREGWSPDRASPAYVGGELRDDRTGRYVRQWMHTQRELGAAQRAVPVRHKLNPPLTAEEIRARHAASLHQGWRRTLDEAHVGWSRNPDDDHYVGSAAQDSRRRVFVERFTDAEREHMIASELLRSRGQPGPYYVSAVRGTTWRPIAGPYADHESALRDVGTAREMIEADFGREGVGFNTSFGTVRHAEAFPPDAVHYTPAQVAAFRLSEAAAREAEVRRAERARAKRSTRGRTTRAKGNRHPESLAHDRREIGGFNLLIERHVPDSGYRYVLLSPQNPDWSRWGGQYGLSSDERRYRQEWAREQRRAVDAMWALRARIRRPNAHIALEELPGAGALYWRDRGEVTTDSTDDIANALAEILGVAKPNRAARQRAMPVRALNLRSA